MEKSYVLLGSNMGDRTSILEEARNMIEARCGKIIKISSLYESEPWGFVSDENFINQAICVETDLSAHELLRELLSIEIELGRDRSRHYETYVSRPIDLDVIYYGEMINDDRELILPHPRLQLRRFVLEPLCEIAPDFIHPVFKVSNKVLLERCCDDGKVYSLECRV